MNLSPIFSLVIFVALFIHQDNALDIETCTNINYANSKSERVSLKYNGQTYQCQKQLIPRNRVSQKKCDEYKATTIDINGGNFPYLGLLLYKNNQNWHWFGSLISDKFVLTSAYAAGGFSDRGNVLKVRLGLTSENQNFIEVNVAKTHIHPNYHAGQDYDDLALLELADKVVFDDNINPVCLQATEEIEESDFEIPCEVIQDLQRYRTVDIRLKSKNTCNPFVQDNKKSLPQGMNSTSQFCAGMRRVGCGDTCRIIHTLPLHTKIYRSTVYKLVGLIEYTITPDTEKTGSRIFNRISNYIDWIENIVWNESSPELDFDIRSKSVEV